MSKIHILGSCSGTEPMVGRHHTAWVLEHRDRLYWFDAGENCSYTAHLMGLDLLKIRHVFISHPHMDHVGGLGNLLWTIRKLTIVRKIETLEPVAVHMPSLPQFNAVMGVLGETEGKFQCCFPVEPHKITDGVIFDDGEVRVEARHNLHLGFPENGEWKSFSFRIAVNGLKLVYSGDVRSVDDLDGWTGNCDWLLMESGHHSPEAVCRHLAEQHAGIKNLLWLHHGRTMLADPAGEKRRTEALWPGTVIVADDGMTIPL